jgi:hypothetical protein
LTYEDDVEKVVENKRERTKDVSPEILPLIRGKIYAYFPNEILINSFG